MDGQEGIKFEPQEGGQIAFLTNPAYEVLYEGDTGGGKTYAMIFDSLGFQFRGSIGKAAYEIPEYRGYLFRRQTNQLTELIDKAKQIYSGIGGEFIYGRRGDPGVSWNFPSGAKIYICHMHRELDMYNFHGLPIHFAGFDELTTFLISQYVYIFSRTRSTIPGLIPRVRATTNAVGIGVKWVRKRFIENLLPGKVYWFITNQDPQIDPQGKLVDRNTSGAISRSYVESNLPENTALMKGDPNYRDRVAALGPKWRKALLEKNWYAFEGQFFDMLSRSIHMKPSFEIPDDWFITGGMDYGNTTVVELIARDYNFHKYFFEEWTQEGEDTEEKAKNFVNWLEEIGMLEKEFVIHADTNMFALYQELKEKISPADKFNALLKARGSKIKLVPVIKKSPDNRRFRVFCNDEFKSQLMWEKNSEGLWIKRNRITIFEDRCPKLFETMQELPTDENDIQDIDPDTKVDHWYDAGKYGLINASGIRIDKTKMKNNLKTQFQNLLKKAV